MSFAVAISYSWRRVEAVFLVHDRGRNNQRLSRLHSQAVFADKDAPVAHKRAVLELLERRISHEKLVLASCGGG